MVTSLSMSSGATSPLSISIIDLSSNASRGVSAGMSRLRNSNRPMRRGCRDRRHISPSTRGRHPYRAGIEGGDSWSPVSSGRGRLRGCPVTESRP